MADTRRARAGLRGGVLAGLVLVLGGAAGCGGDEPSSAPDDASQEDFCRVYAGIEADEGDDLESARDAVERLLEVGTPEDMPDDARSGFETLGELVRGAGDDADLETLGEDLGQQAQDDFLALIGYVTRTCAEELDLPTEEDLGELDPGSP